MVAGVPLLIAASGWLVAVAEGKPNFVFMLTDDQDTRLGESDHYTDIGSVASQPKLRELYLANGARFTNYFVNTPICCPSRTEFFTGRYFPNVRGAKGDGCMHANTTHAALKNEGLFGTFTSNGYEVGLFGKVTNDQQAQLELLAKYESATYIDAPLNFNDYYGLPYYHYYASNNTQYTENIDPNDPVFGTPYQTSQIGNRTMRWLDDIFTRDVGTPEHPFFLYIGPHAPHFPADPAPWYEDLWSNLTIPITPNYNVSSPDKTRHIRQNPPLTAQVKCWEDQHFRDRWAALMSVDDLVADVHAKIAAQGDAVLRNTYFFYTSDHGYKQGQWRIGTSKQHPYETDIRIPFFAVGPGILPGTIVEEMCGNVDLMPTLLDMAGIPAPPMVDGKSFKNLLIANEGRAEAAEGWRKKFLNVYEATGSYFNDHSPCWAPPGYEEKCGGPMPRSPDGSNTTADCKESSGVGDGNCYWVDSLESNSWRALRVMNATHDTQYIEYDATWSWNETSVTFYEYYDIAADPYQMKNGYPDLSDSAKAAMHRELSDYYSCSTSSCP
ncbi:Extracellular sulfatase SULF-1-like protein [Diplonema papillatum]|nr:Extracellular sulfatase SULF-1-like protein [Diplonema papillatum]